MVRRLGHEPLFFAPSMIESPPEVDAVVLEPSWERGLAVARELRARDSRLPLVYISIHPPGELEPEALALGARSHLLKPFSLSQLKDALALIGPRLP